MRFLLGLILLAFPIAEIALLIMLGQRYGVWLLLYLVVVGWLGLRLIRDEKHVISAKMMSSLAAGGNPVKVMLGSARNMVAGILLLIPGVLSDIIAVILLLIPIKHSQHSSHGAFNHDKSSSYNPYAAANDEVIEGEYVKVVEETHSIPDKQ